VPIEVRLAGKLTLVKPVHPSKAELPIEVTVLGIVTEVKPPAAKTRVVPSFVYTTLSTALYLLLPLSTVILVKPLQFSKAPSPIEVRLVGKFTLFKPLQSPKALSLIEVRLAGKLTLVKPVHPAKALKPIEVRLAGKVTLVIPVHK